jgi:hypothetical protein
VGFVKPKQRKGIEMTKEEYKEYEYNVEQFMFLNGLDNLTRIDNEQEPYFSWMPCECCGSRLGGDRIDASGYSKSKVAYEFSICTDCEYYAEYGQLDDMTMLDMEE